MEAVYAPVYVPVLSAYTPRRTPSYPTWRFLNAEVIPTFQDEDAPWSILRRYMGRDGASSYTLNTILSSAELSIVLPLTA